MFFTEHFRTTAFELPAVLAIWISLNIWFHCFFNLSKCNYDRQGSRDVVNFFFVPAFKVKNDPTHGGHLKNGRSNMGP